MFSDKTYAEQVNKLSFEQVSKILSDLVHHGTVTSVALKFVTLLPDTSKSSQKKKDEAPVD